MGKKFVLLGLTFFTVVMLGIVSITFQFLTSTKASIHEEVERNGKFDGRLEDISFNDKDPITILLIGLDQKPGESGGQTDTMVLLTLDPQTKSMHMVSIPRDTYAKINGGLNKINNAYQVGGIEMTLDSVERLLDVPVDYFVTMNMEGFEGMVDAFDGVEVNNDMDFTYKKEHFPEGKLTLDGREALLYARMRKHDPRGDFGRQERQRQVIEALMEKGKSISSITQMGEIVTVLRNNIKTNMSFLDMLKLQLYYKDAVENVEQHKIEGADRTIKGTYYYAADKEKLQALSQNLKEHLKLGGQDSYAGKEPLRENKEANKPEEENTSESGDKTVNDSDKAKDVSEKEKEREVTEDTSENIEQEEIVKDSDKPNVTKEITKNWPSVPTNQENHTMVTFEEGSVDWEEMTSAIALGAGLSEQDMILWWVAGDGTDSVIATVTNKAQTENYRVFVSWVDGAGYTPTKVEVLEENDKKQ